MKRFVLASGLCTAMLMTAVFVFMPAGMAKGLFAPAAPQKEDVLEALLDLPAPPPPNPLENATPRDDSFYDPKKPPPDNAPIDDLIDYWTHQSSNYRGVLFYVPRPSERVIQRLLSEGGTAIVPEVLNVLSEDKRTGEIVRQMYDDPSTPKDLKGQLRSWLTLNSSYFSDDTARNANLLKDVDNYVSVPHQNALLALTRHDWDRARPIVDRLYNDSSQPVSRALAIWALYRHAMETGDIGDTDRYRSELMRTVENRNLPDGVRDMANDALVREPDFPGRDEWCWSLFQDETLVNMPYFTGLTTIVMYAPPDKYVAKMAEFVKSDNKTVRTAAARNLITVMEREKSPDVIRALLPWIGDSKWIDRSPDDSNRVSLVTALQNIKMPESVPELISALDEKATRPIEDYRIYSDSANRVQLQANIMANAMNTAANRAVITSSNTNVNRAVMKEETYYPLREYAIRALATQADARAVPALRRLLTITANYQRVEIMRALLACGGYSVSEQLDALEYYAKTALGGFTETRGYSKANSNAGAMYYISNRPYLGSTEDPESDPKVALGVLVASNTEPGDELVRSTIGRIEVLEKRDQATAENLRRIISNWNGLAISALLLSDLRTGKIASSSIIRLLAERKTLRENLPQDLDELRTGTPTAAGIAGCLTGSAESYAAMFDGKSTETRTAFLACSRLIRNSLPLDKVSEQLRSTDELLKRAAEEYLVSEDSPAARTIVYAMHPGEAKILGATAFFKGGNDDVTLSPEMLGLFLSVNSGIAFDAYMPFYNGSEWNKQERELQLEVKSDPDLVGLYSYKDSLVRITKQHVSFTWGNDPSRYSERFLSREEFESLKALISGHNVTEMKPFLACRGNCEEPREFIMLGKNGGSRVFARTARPQFFLELEKLFDRFRAEPSNIKYALSKDVPGLELLFASDQYDAQTVWKQGSDLRVVISDRSVREKVDEDVGEIEETDDEGSADDEEAADVPSKEPQMIVPSERMRLGRQYEGFGWFKLANGDLGAAVTQPAGVEYIPVRDSLDVQPTDEQWKARAPGLEIRTDPTGLYEIAGGKISKLRAGIYSQPVISPNGRWLIVNKFEEDIGPSTIRYDLATGREYKVKFDGYGNLVARCFVPASEKFLLAAGYYEEGYYEPDNEEEETSGGSQSRFYLLDPESGALMPASGEARPLSAQTFRALQPAAKPNEFWAALPSHAHGDTVVGLFDSRSLRFSPLLKLPKINFSSMDMWVDETENKVYFVYSGHLLRVPLKSTQPTNR